MNDICFKVQGVSLQLGAGHILRAAAATTPCEREKHINAAGHANIPVGGLTTLAAIINTIHPEHMEMDELPEPFCDLEGKSEEEIAEWIVQEVKKAKQSVEEEEKA